MSHKILASRCSSLPSVSSQRRTFYFRIFVCLCLFSTAIICGYFSYTLLYNQETELLNIQYDSLVSQLKVSQGNYIKAQIQAISLGSHYFQSYCPDASSWPDCSATIPLQTFDNMTIDLIPLTKYRSLNLSPIVPVSQLESFESVALNYYKSNGYDTLGTTSNGVRGIYARENGVAYHDNNTTKKRGKYQILVPVFNIGNLKENTGAALLNTYAEPIQAKAIDFLIECAKSNTFDFCGLITDFVQLAQDGVNKRPGALIFSALRAFNQPNQMVGKMASVINWDTTFTNAIPDYVKGLVVILNSGTKKFTYTLSDGIVTFKGDGDLHDKAYDSFAYEYVATSFESSSAGVVYTATVYPSDEFYNQYHTSTPFIACVVSVFVIIFTSLVFLTYDYFVNRQVEEKDIIIATRREFVNFISHEIRTPLNTISSGMDLLTSEMKTKVEAYYAKKLKSTEENVTDVSTTSTNKEVLTIRDVEDYLALVTDIEDSSYMAIAILNDILNYDKLMQGKLKLEIENFNIWDLVKSSSRSFSIQALQKDVNYEFQFQLENDKFYKTNNYSNKMKKNRENSDIVNEQINDSRDENDENDMRQVENVQYVSNQDYGKSIKNKSLSTDSFIEFLEMKNLLVIGDKIKISQVLRNMISNALKFTPSGGKVVVSANWEQHDERFMDLIVKKCSNYVDTEKRVRDEESNKENKSKLLLEKRVKSRRSSSLSMNMPSARSKKVHIETTSAELKSVIQADFQYAGSVTINVTDSGVGLSDEQLSQMFQEGIQFNVNKLQGGGGSGLGLWISKGIVDMHYGILTASSPGIGMGCTFTLILPVFTCIKKVKDDISFFAKYSRIEDSTKEIVSQSDKIKISSTSTPLSTPCTISTPNITVMNEKIQKKNSIISKTKSFVTESVKSSEIEIVNQSSVVGINRILIVDDSISNRKMTARLLKSKGYEVDEAVDGIDAVEKVMTSLNSIIVDSIGNQISNGYDAILMDFEMPNMSGPNATEILRQKGYKGIIIGVTGNVMNAEKQLFLSKGANDVLFKPCDLNKIEKALQH